ncbi:MAG: gamma-glutamylcyclotransferase [Planctomycetales bacterium]|nr:gamma-glutamylcyclotransferase [bacterium]UNM07147.1 MAG: gamma-glutamylcyclotransferase [Planctomycetales bacterium]
MSDSPRRLYFAYGSNLSRDQMADRCPAALPLAPYALGGHRLEFVGEGNSRWGRGGVATVVPQPGSSVPGALWLLTPECEAALDRFEGVDSGRYFRDEQLMQHDGNPVLIYIATDERGAANKPNRKYLDVITLGYANWQLDPSGLLGIECYREDEGWPPA